MRSLPGIVLSAAALLMTGAAIVPVEPAKAAFSFNVSFGFDTFRDRLGDRGRWIRSPVWGDVWQPRRRLVGDDFQPYTNGYWEYTDEYGWYWVSDDPFDDVVYHYGRWVYDPDMRWVWIPGYTWSPGWVVWREGGGYSGWMPMPPDEQFISGTGLSLGLNFGSAGVNFYGYDRWYGNRVDPGRFWVVVDNRNLADRDYRRFVVPRERARLIINNTRNVTKFVVVNNRVVNRSIDVKVVERASGRRIAPVPAREVIKPNAVITTVDESNRVRERERVAHPINTGFVKGGGANNATGAKVGPGPGPGPGSRSGAMTGGANGATEVTPGHIGPVGPGGTGGATPEVGRNQEHRPGAQQDHGGGNATTGTASPGGDDGQGPKSDERRRNPKGGTASGASDTGATTDTGGPAPEKPKHERNNSAATGGAATGSSGTPPAGATSTGDNAAPGSNPDRATRGPRSITPSDNAMSGPSDNNTAQPSGPKHRAANPGGTGMSGPAQNGAPAANGAPPAQQPDNSTPKKKNPKHNPPGTTPDSGTPQ